jgi:hypothetical protein
MLKVSVREQHLADATPFCIKESIVQGHQSNLADRGRHLEFRKIGGTFAQSKRLNPGRDGS